MAMRAQPVLVEVEARKRWSLQNTSAARGSVDSPDNVGTGGMSQGGGTSWWHGYAGYGKRVEQQDTAPGLGGYNQLQAL